MPLRFFAGFFSAIISAISFNSVSFNSLFDFSVSPVFFLTVFLTVLMFQFHFLLLFLTFFISNYPKSSIILCLNILIFSFHSSFSISFNYFILFIRITSSYFDPFLIISFIIPIFLFILFIFLYCFQEVLILLDFLLGWKFLYLLKKL